MSAMRRPPHDGQNPLRLHENATSRSWPHASQCTRREQAKLASVGQDAALEVGADLALHEASDGGSDRSRVLEEWLEVLAYDMMKKPLLRLVACVGNRIVVAGTGLVWKPLRNRRAGSRGERKHLTPCPVPSPSFEVGRPRPLVHGAFVNGGLIGCRSIGAGEDRADSNSSEALLPLSLPGL